MTILTAILQLLIAVVEVEDSLLMNNKIRVLMWVLLVNTPVIVAVIVLVVLVVGFALDTNVEWEGDILDCTELTTIVQVFVLQTEKVPLPPPIAFINTRYEKDAVSTEGVLQNVNNGHKKKGEGGDNVPENLQKSQSKRKKRDIDIHRDQPHSP